MVTTLGWEDRPYPKETHLPLCVVHAERDSGSIKVSEISACRPGARVRVELVETAAFAATTDVTHAARDSSVQQSQIVLQIRFTLQKRLWGCECVQILFHCWAEQTVNAAR